MKIRIFGAAGTGKTTYLISKVVEELHSGIYPDGILFTTFTKSAARHARKRAMRETGYVESDLPYFSTMHSICFRMLGIKRENVVMNKHRKEFCEEQGVDYTETQDTDEELSVLEGMDSIGNIYFSIIDGTRIAYPDAEYPLEMWREFVDDPTLVHYPHLVKFAHDWYEYKQSNGLYDFVDMIEEVLKQGIKPPTPVQFYDEFQDMYPLLYKLYKLWSVGATKVYLAGDPYQVLYGYMNATPNIMTDEQVDEEVVLSYSHRVPKQIWDYAINTLSLSTEKYYNIEMVQPADRTGAVSYMYVDSVDKVIDPYTDTFILTRIWYYANVLSKELIEAGIPFNYIRRGGGWTEKDIKIHNAILALVNGWDIQYEALHTLINNLPTKGILKYGLKTEFKKGKYAGRDYYTYNDFRQMLEPAAREFPPLTLLYRTTLSHTKKYAIEQALKRDRRIDKINIHLGTVHAAKGLEAPNVILLNDITNKIHRNMNFNSKDYNAEVRCFYVGITRAMEKLIILDNYIGGMTFDLPSV